MKKQAEAVDPAETQVRALTKSLEPFVEESLALQVTTPEGFVQSAALLKEIKGKIDQADELRRTLTRPLDEAKKRIMDLFNGPINQLKGAEKLVKGNMIDFQNTEARRLRAEQEAAEAEREKEAARLAKLADKAADKGQMAKAAALNDMAVALPEVVAPPPTQVAGIATRTLYSAEVTDFEALVKAVAAGTYPLGLLLPNQQALNALARASKNGELTIPGVAVRSESSMAAGR